MVRSFLNKVFGETDEKIAARYLPMVAEINKLEPEFQSLSDDELRAMTEEFRQRLADGKEDLDDLLPESFAVTREVTRRVLGQRHYDVQLIGGMVLHQGKIAEMRTGEGKTQTATLAIALNALEGQGVHLVTVNDYLVRRDAAWMGQVYHALGLSVGAIQHESAFIYDPEYETEDEGAVPNMRPVTRKEAYQADITYGTNNEFGFDYLRDNMVTTAARKVQRGQHFAIVDEVDNILIDEARTPLIISGAAAQATDKYYQFAQIAKQLRKDRDYEVELKSRTVNLTDEGIDKVEQLAQIPEGESIYDDRYIELTHYLEQAVKAEVIFKRDKDYIVDDEGEVIIVDEFTGRLMPGRRYSEGLHQAIEAKEGVRVRRQNVTMATITFQNYFRMYDKLAGMTGTAKTEAEEFHRIYSLDVVTVPTNVPVAREDAADLVFRTEEGKFRAVAREITEMRNAGRPVLVGTTSIDTSERLSRLLNELGTPHQVLNAKQHEREASVVAEAGQAPGGKGNVTIATNMAGRGTDIKLSEEVRKAGGLHIIGTERHESRRIDNQLRGRAGRQGDPGSSRFFVSLEDDLMKRFGSDRLQSMMDRLGMTDETPIEHGLISKSIESAQQKTEGHNFDIRKHVVQYDDVMNRHREVIYADRDKVVSGEDMSERIAEMISDEIDALITRAEPAVADAEFDYEGLIESYRGLIGRTELTLEDVDGLSKEELADLLVEDADAALDAVEEQFPDGAMRTVERHVMLSVIDRLWVQHLTQMDDLREGAGLQAYAQRDPLVIYKTNAFNQFNELLGHIRHDVVSTLFRVQPAVAQQPVQTVLTETATTTNQPTEAAEPATQTVRRERKVGPNQPCWCGSGKKYKHCHGAPKTAIAR
ncbi:MAG TPA: preprotein translocase subunit SecA [Thermomicrobiales bacterium]|jgi:preprotein translocase subunit SecA|nr:preprotein translocase subunit SecA [Thermomicrobiales bacterium]